MMLSDSYVEGNRHLLFVLHVANAVSEYVSKVVYVLHSSCCTQPQEIMAHLHVN